MVALKSGHSARRPCRQRLKVAITFASKSVAGNAVVYKLAVQW